MLNASMKRLKQSMAYANELDAKVWVFHPGAKTGIGQFYPGVDWKQNIESIKQLYKSAEEYGVNIALENLPAKYYFFMSKPEEFARFYKETNLPIGIVMDLGHANLEGHIEGFFNLLADKIVHIHASDNDGSDDQHLGIGYGKIDYTSVAQMLKQIGYDKSVIIESITNVPETITKLKQLLA
jgi:sugar phosphate isomerase/epimerase